MKQLFCRFWPRFLAGAVTFLFSANLFVYFLLFQSERKRRTVLIISLDARFLSGKVRADVRFL